MPTLTPISGALGKKRAAHLLRRATFGPTQKQIDEFAALEVSAALDALLVDPSETRTPPIDPKTGKSWLPKPVEPENSDDDALFGVFKAWFLEKMRNSGATLNERMTYFYHTHLPADNVLIRNTTSLYYQNELYRKYALGDFKKMFTKVTADNAMLLYIDNTLNDVDSPNENYAREMFELYSIGKGTQTSEDDYTNYNEHDVQQAARVLTGLKHDFEFKYIDTETDLPRGYFEVSGEEKKVMRHDAKPKVFSKRFGETTIEPKPDLMVGDVATEEGAWDEINQLMDMIFNQDETARFICRKLYRFFVYYKIDDKIEAEVIEPLAKTFRTNNYAIKPVLRQLFCSTHFYNEDTDSSAKGIIGAQIKSPIELTLGMFRAFNIDLPTDEAILYKDAYPSILESLDFQGISFYAPIDVAGYPPYHQVPAYNRNWISPNSIARRYQLSHILIKGETDEADNIMYKLDVVTVAKALFSDMKNPTKMVEELAALLFPREIPTERFDYFVKEVLLDEQDESEWIKDWTKYESDNDDTAVRVQLEKLFNAMLQSPEYQLF